MKNYRFVSFVAILLLGACSHYSEELSSLDSDMKAAPQTFAYNAAATPQDIAPAAGNSGESFTQYLARDYYELAKYENDKAFDYKAAKLFTQKAMDAAKGTVPAPTTVSSYDIPDNLKPSLDAAQRDLTTALKDRNTPENAAALANAQTQYECWLDRAEEATDANHYAGCQSAFEGAMAALTMPAAGPEMEPMPATPVLPPQTN